jgi:hypothetical protein
MALVHICISARDALGVSWFYIVLWVLDMPGDIVEATQLEQVNMS